MLRMRAMKVEERYVESKGSLKCGVEARTVKRVKKSMLKVTSY